MRTIWRQAALVGLVIFLVGTAVRVLWLAKPTQERPGGPEPAPKELSGLVAVIDPGHGGTDPGAVVSGTREKVITLQISLLVKELLEERGAKVILTRETDEDLGGTLREGLDRRVAMVTEHGANLFVSIHANKDRCNCWGAQTFFQKDGNPEGQVLAKAVQARLRELTPTTRQALAANYRVLRTSPVPATVVEVGFLSNATEHAKLLDEKYQRILATAVAHGVADYHKARAAQ